MNALTLVGDSETLGEDLTRQVVSAHIEEERLRLKGKINDVRDDWESSYNEILALTSFSPDIEPKVYELMKKIAVSNSVKQEIASCIVLRSPSLEKNLLGYIEGIAKINRPEDTSIPHHLATATENGLLEDVVNAGYAGIVAVRELSENPARMKEAVNVVNNVGIFESSELQEQAAQFAADYIKKNGDIFRTLSSKVYSLSERLKLVIEYAATYKENKGYPYKSGYENVCLIKSDLLKALGNTIIAELVTLQHNKDATHAYLSMVRGLCIMGKYPSSFENEGYGTAKDNARHFSDTVTYVQLLHATMLAVPIRIKQEFFGFVEKTQKEKSDGDRKINDWTYANHPLADHLIMTLSIANHFYKWEGGIKEGSELEKVAYEAVKSLHHLEAEKGLSNHGRMLPVQYYRRAMTLPSNSIAVYGKLLEIGLTEDVQFGLASMEPLQRLLQEHPVQIVETLYATAINTLRESNWHYAMGVLENGTAAIQKLVGIGQRGLKLLEGGTIHDACRE